MKDKIIIPKDKIKVLTSCDHFPANGYFTFYKEDVEVEQVPENWEDLKELCKKFCLKIISDIIYCYGGLNFHKDGTIKDNDNSIIKINRTPQQMWQIIKSLIGEE